MCSFAFPVIVGHRPYAFTVAMGEIPRYSMSKFIMGVSGTLVAFVWPMRIAIAMLARARDSFSWLSSLINNSSMSSPRTTCHTSRSGRALLHGSHLPTANTMSHWNHWLSPWSCPTTPLSWSGNWTVMQVTLSLRREELMQRPCGEIPALSSKGIHCGSGWTV